MVVVGARVGDQTFPSNSGFSSPLALPLMPMALPGHFDSEKPPLEGAAPSGVEGHWWGTYWNAGWCLDIWRSSGSKAGGTHDPEPGPVGQARGCLLCPAANLRSKAVGWCS
jgi:hypothetical protein